MLPAYCVKTNAPLAPEDMREHRLSWCSPVFGLLILLSGFLLVLVYFIVRKRCILVFGVAPAVRKRNRTWMVVKIVSAVLLFFALPPASMSENPTVVLGVLIMFLVTVVSIFIGNALLGVAKYRNGELWVTGCSKEFLAHCER